MNELPLCPLFIMSQNRVDSECRCMESDCGWFTTSIEECAIKALAHHLNNMDDTLTRIETSLDGIA